MSSVYLPTPRISAVRLSVLSVLLLLGFVLLLVAGFVRLQSLHGKLDNHFFKTHYASSVLPAHRGSIFGRDGDSGRAPLAMNSDLYDVAIEPPLLASSGRSDARRRRQAEALAEALDMTPDEVLAKMGAEVKFAYLKKRVSPWAAERVRGLSVPGVYPKYKSERFYPDAMSFAHVLGFTNWQGIGLAGIEYVNHENLRAADGEVRYIQAGGRGAVSELQYQPAESGRNLHLTLDRRLQFATFGALADAVNRHAAKSAAAIVMEVERGDVLALASYPSFNPNHIRADEDDAARINHALADVVEPGSTVKPFVAALALETRAVAADEIFQTKSALRVRDLRVHDKHVREDLDLAGIVRKSSSVGAVRVAWRIGRERLEQFYRDIGIGGGKVLGFPNEGEGALRSHRGWYDTDFATHSYGYGFSMTLVQLLRAYSALATDGVLLSPRLSPRAPLTARRRVISAETARAVREMMEGVVSEDGTARAAAIPGYRVAGKTGTAFKVVEGEYSSDHRRVFFVGMAPASAPRYLIAVMVDEPTRDGDSGGAVAAPAFQQIMRQALLFGGVRPDAVVEVPAAAARVAVEGG